MTTAQRNAQQRLLNLRTNPGFLIAAAAAIATVKKGEEITAEDIQRPENNGIAATSTRDFHGIDRTAHRVLEMRKLPFNGENYQLVLSDVVNGKLSREERYRGIIAFEGDATSTKVATGGIAKVQPEVPLFMLVDYKDPSVDFKNGAWEKNPRFVQLGAKMQKTAQGLNPVLPQYLS